MVSSRRDLIPLRQSGQRPKTCPLSGGAPKNAIFLFLAMGTKSFKENVLDSILTGAKSYQSLLGFDFVVKSDAFRFRGEYVIRFHADNFLHLTGVGTSLSPKEFFFKAVDGSLSLDDFDCEATPQRKGTVRLKSETFETLERSSIGLSRSRKNLCPVALSAYLLRPMEPSPWVLRAERWLTQ